MIIVSVSSASVCMVLHSVTEAIISLTVYAGLGSICFLIPLLETVSALRTMGCKTIISFLNCSVFTVHVFDLQANGCSTTIWIRHIIKRNTDAQETNSMVPLRREVVKYDQCVPVGPDGPTQNTWLGM